MPQASSTSVSPRILEKRRRRRAEILHAALQAFGEKGYHTTTLGHIAARVGVQKTALYHYFPDKEAILYACHQESVGELNRLLEVACGTDMTASARLHHVIREHVRVMTDTLEGSSIAFEGPAFSPGHQAEIIAARDRYERGLREIIAHGVSSGEFGPVDPKVAVFALLGAINWIARWYNPKGSIATAELGAEYADYLVGGLTCKRPH